MKDYFYLYDTKKAAERSGLSQSYIKQLCKSFGSQDLEKRGNGTHFFSKKIGNSWVLDFDEFSVFYLLNIKKIGEECFKNDNKFK